ncbi:MAG: sulfotransferase domain-containing protein [Gammaproteobacteria bacterium]|nr:sulfotransferase domain-containing protein [Gammaproteobacteria bacterium]
MSAQPKIVWLASYPKSGNTWVRFMLLNLLMGKQTSTENLDKVIPDIHVLMPHYAYPPRLNIPPGATVLMKSHFMLWPEMPFINLTAGFIYIVRNPLDIVASAVNYEFLKKAAPADAGDRQKARDQYVQDFIAHGAVPGWIEARWGTWDDNVRSYAFDKHPFPGLVLKYEDLVREPLAQLTRIVDFLGYRTDAQTLQNAVDASSFDNMRRIEDQEVKESKPGFFSRESSTEGLDAGFRFMSRGKPGGSKITLTDSERAQLLDRFGPTMERLGYPVHE